MGLQTGNWRFYLRKATVHRERPLGSSRVVGLYWEVVQSHIKGKWHHTSPENRHLSSSTIPTHRLKLKHTPKCTTPSRKIRALLFQATTGLVSNSQIHSQRAHHWTGAKYLWLTKDTSKDFAAKSYLQFMQRHCCSNGISMKVSAHHEENTNLWCMSEYLQVNYRVEKATEERINLGVS